MIKQKCNRFIEENEKDIIDFLLYKYIFIMFYEYTQCTKKLLKKINNFKLNK